MHTKIHTDDIIGDEESHVPWQDRVSSGFDRLVAFASTELTKTGRHSIDDVSTVGAATSSPDSGINHSDSGGSAGSCSAASSIVGHGGSSAGPSMGRTYLSTSSTLSQPALDELTPHHHHPLHYPQQQHQHHLRQQQQPKFPPAELLHQSLESPPFAETGSSATRSPSPPANSSSPTPPTPSVATMQHHLLRRDPYHMQTVPPSESNASSSASHGLGQTSTSVSGGAGGSGDTSLKIPLKYQRHHHQKHYKKKFRERTWEEYDYGDDGGGAGSSSGTPLAASLDAAAAADVSGLSASAVQSASSAAAAIDTESGGVGDVSTLHKSSKFRPKGKDWDWRTDQHRNNSKNSNNAKTTPADLAPV